MDKVLIFITFICVLSCCHPSKEGDKVGCLVLTHDRNSVIHDDTVHPIDLEETLSFYPNKIDQSPNAVFLLPDKNIFWAVSSKMDLPCNWLSLKDSIRLWFKSVPYLEGNGDNKLQKVLPVMYDFKQLDSSLIGAERYEMLQSDYSRGLQVTQSDLFIVLSLKRIE